MNRDEGQYFLPHIFDEILIKKHQIDKSTGNTKNIARRQSSDSSQWWLRQQLIAETYTVSAYFGSEFDNYCLSLLTLQQDNHQFFDSKIETIRDELANCTPPPMSVDIKDSCVSSFSNFGPVDCKYVRKIIMDSTKTSCPLDPIPTWILAKPEILDALLPVITRIVNISFTEGVIPMNLKRHWSRRQMQILTSSKTIGQHQICPSYSRPLNALLANKSRIVLIQTIWTKTTSLHIESTTVQRRRSSELPTTFCELLAIITMSSSCCCTAFNTLDNTILLQRFRNELVLPFTIDVSSAWLSTALDLTRSRFSGVPLGDLSSDPWLSHSTLHQSKT